MLQMANNKILRPMSIQQELSIQMMRKIQLTDQQVSTLHQPKMKFLLQHYQTRRTLPQMKFDEQIIIF
jgi:hypothetical protein